MKLGIIAGYSGRKFSISIDSIKHAENLGYESIWTAEAYGSDAVTPAAWILAQTDRIKVGTAIMQMPARSPADGSNDRNELGGIVWWALYCWFRCVRPAGCGRLARRALRQASESFARVCAHNEANFRPRGATVF